MSFLEKHRIKNRRAKERIKAIKNFYLNLLAYCIVIPFFAYFNYNTANFYWVFWAMSGWGVGLLTQGMLAFDYHPIFNKKWEERKIQELMNNPDF